MLQGAAQRPKAWLCGNGSDSVTLALRGVVDLIGAAPIVGPDSPDLFILDLDASVAVDLHNVVALTREFPGINFLIIGSKRIFNQMAPVLKQIPYMGCILNNSSEATLSEAVEAVIAGRRFYLPKEKFEQPPLGTGRIPKRRTVTVRISGPPIAKAEFIKTLESRVKSAWCPPHDVSSMHLELDFSVDAEGMLTSMRVVQFVCSPQFEQSVLKALRSVELFELPKQMPYGFNASITFFH